MEPEDVFKCWAVAFLILYSMHMDGILPTAAPKTSESLQCSYFRHALHEILSSTFLLSLIQGARNILAGIVGGNGDRTAEGDEGVGIDDVGETPIKTVLRLPCLVQTKL